jgi:hypothetical protein
MKTFLKIYISLSLILSPIFLINSANAATLGGWTIGGLVADGASSVVNASKTIVVNGANVVKTSTARITPTVGAVSKVLRGGAAGYALSIAVQQLLGAVDWVLDPANNRITYKEPSDPSQPNALFAHPTTPSLGNVTASQACQAFMQWQQTQNWASARFTITGSGTNYKCNFVFDLKNGTKNQTYKYDLIYRTATQPQEQEQKSIPLDVVAAKVITNADTHPDSDKKAGSQVATTTAAQDLLNNDSATQSDVENQLNTNARTNTAEGANEATGETKPNVADPTKIDLKLAFPAFCGWAPTICEAAQVAIQFPARVQTWVDQVLVVGEKIETEQKRTTAEAAKTAQAAEAIKDDMANEEGLPQKDTTDIVLPDLPITPQSVNVNWGNSCPPPTTATLSMFGQSTEITLINYDPICQWAWVVEYSVIALASISSVFIVAGRKS